MVGKKERMNEGKKEKEKKERWKEKLKEGKPRVELECGPAQPSLFPDAIPMGNFFP